MHEYGHMCCVNTYECVTECAREFMSECARE